ncbi:MAG TPA: OmpA family protein [Daejeonella sp.]|nr:OmpA family protein [Daejeonella sp.]
MMRIALLFVLSLLLSGVTRAQDEILIKGDLKAASTIDVNRLYSFKKGPSGNGKLKEFKINPARSTTIFREERNSAWFLINVPFNGILTFDVIPHQVKDDYDWMLFKYSNELDKNIRSELAIPVRTNNARNAIAQSSKTGMATGAASKLVKPGPGNNYSLPLSVRSGDKLALVLDNIYGGQGFNLFVRLTPDIAGPLVYLTGTVWDRNSSKTLSAEITIEDDSTGVLIGKSATDSITGSYKIKVPANRPLNVTASHPDYIFATADTFILKDATLDFYLETPVSGNKIVLNNIHFHPNKDEILSSSMPELDRLLHFMRERPDWTVKITGHTNQNVFASAKYLQQLSFNRALAVKKYLTKNAISEKRISCAGVGGKTPVVVTKDPTEGLKNLRVEVTLLRIR